MQGPIEEYNDIMKDINMPPIVLDDSVESFEKTIEYVQDSDINFLRMGYSDEVIEKFYFAKAKVLLYLKEKYHSIVSGSIEKNETIKDVYESKHMHPGDSIREFNGILKNNAEAAALIIKNSSGRVKYAMQVNLQRSLTGRKILFSSTETQQMGITKKLTYPVFMDLKLHMMKRVVLPKEDTITTIHIAAKRPTYMFFNITDKVAMSTEGVSKDIISNLRTVDDYDGSQPDSISPIDIVGVHVTNYFDPHNCRFEDVLRPVYVVVSIPGSQEWCYSFIALDNMQLLTGDIEEEIDLTIPNVLPDIVEFNYRGLNLSKVKSDIREKIKTWTRSDSKVDGVNILVGIATDCMLEGLPALPEEAMLFAKYTISDLVFKERKYLMDMYDSIDQDLVPVILTKLVTRLEKKIVDIDDGIRRLSKISA